jgi:hypothetical protein
MRVHAGFPPAVSRVLRVLGAGHLACAWLLVSSCATEEVLVATLPSDAGLTDVTDCVSNDDCLPTAFCARAGCEDARGLCELRPVFCDDQGPPTCGCDGVSYFNDCLRMQYGASASAPLESCRRAPAACTDENGRDCPVDGAACAKLLPPDLACEESTQGACWVLPAQCPEFGPPDRWMACDDPTDCLDTCGAIRTGRPYRHDVMRQCPPDSPRR